MEDQEQPLSEYEKQRLQNIARNNGVMQSLGLEDATPSKKKKKKAGPSVASKKAPARPSRRSGRNTGRSTPNYTGEHVIGEEEYDDEDDEDEDASEDEDSNNSSSDDDDDEEKETPRKKKTKAAATVFVPLPTGKYDAAAVQKHFPGYSVAAAAPTRDVDAAGGGGGGGAFRFSAAKGASAAEKYRVAEFRPNRSPEEVLRAGAFGGTYFRTIRSAVTKQTYKDAWKELPESWIDGLSVPKQLARRWETYDVSVNKYQAKSGTTLEDWESSGWMTHHDPFGWFQWYCRFFVGRRCDDDDRQIGRWLKCCGPTGRWKGNLCGKIVIARGAAFDDPSVSPVVRQTLLHWGYELTEGDFLAARKRILQKNTGAYAVPRDQLSAAAAQQRKREGKKKRKMAQSKHQEEEEEDDANAMAGGGSGSGSSSSSSSKEAKKRKT